MNNKSGNGIGFFTILFLILLVLKLTGTIAWSWWFVTAPLWGPLVLWIVILIIILIVVFLYHLSEGILF